MAARRTSSVVGMGNKNNREPGASTPPVPLLVDKELLTVTEAAARLNISPRTAWKLVWGKDARKPVLETVWIGKRRFVPRLAVTAYTQQLCAVYGAQATYRLMAG